jgi:hypothetical protein
MIRGLDIPDLCYFDPIIQNCLNRGFESNAFMQCVAHRYGAMPLTTRYRNNVANMLRFHKGDVLTCADRTEIAFFLLPTFRFLHVKSFHFRVDRALIIASIRITNVL